MDLLPAQANSFLIPLKSGLPILYVFGWAVLENGVRPVTIRGVEPIDWLSYRLEVNNLEVAP